MPKMENYWSMDDNTEWSLVADGQRCCCLGMERDYIVQYNMAVEVYCLEKTTERWMEECD